MPTNMEVQGDVIVFYGNKVGYISENQAIVDTSFNRDELTSWLRQQYGLDVVYRTGVYEALANNPTHLPTRPQICRIWQLRPEVDPLVKFVSYDKFVATSGEPPKLSSYWLVFEGDIGTNNLDDIYQICNVDIPKDYKGHSLSMSDIIELSTEDGSEFHYIDSFGFVELPHLQQKSELSIAPGNI